MSEGIDGLGPGEQALVLVSAVTHPLEVLPDEAYENLLLVSTKEHPKEIERRVEERGKDPGGVVVIPVSGSRLRYKGDLQVSGRRGPTDLTGIGVDYVQGLNVIDGDAWVVFDNINVFLMYANEENVYQFMDTAIRNAKNHDARGAYFTVRDAIKDETYSQFLEMCDTEIDLR